MSVHASPELAARVPSPRRDGPRHRLRWLVGAAALSLLVWLIFVRTVIPLDLDVFVSAGRAVAHGQNPYPALGTTQVWSGSAFVYPWLTAWLFAPATAISSHTAALLMTALSAAAVAAGVWSLVGWRLVPFACVLFAAPTIDGLQMGTLNAILFLGVCVAWRWRDRPAHVGVTIGVLVTLKILCWPLAVWLLLTRRWRATSWALGSGTVLMGAGWLLGPLGPVSYARMLGQLSSHEIYTSSGLQGVLVRWSLPVLAAEVIGLACTAALMTVVAERSDSLVYATAIVAALVASPVVWHHYYLLAAAPLLLTKNGAWWYLLVGWASQSARVSHGVSWQPIAVAAGVGLTIAGAVLIWRSRVALGTMLRPPYGWRAGAAGAAGTVLILVGVLAGFGVLVRGLAPTVVPVGASLAMLAVAFARTRHVRRAQPLSDG